ncbi:MAG: hypothetical protein FJ009_06195 [Chloroflexi bacterium]|nr:hypothetical protein [Chloroflexota bacterium]
MPTKTPFSVGLLSDPNVRDVIQLCNISAVIRNRKTTFEPMVNPTLQGMLDDKQIAEMRAAFKLLIEICKKAIRDAEAEGFELSIPDPSDLVEEDPFNEEAEEKRRFYEQRGG